MRLKLFKDFSLNEERVVGFDDENKGNFVVMMGGPGSGKSFTSGNLLNLKNYKYINVDTYRENLAKKLGLDIKNPEDNQKILDMTYTTSDPRNKTIQFLKKFLQLKSDSDTELPNVVFDAGGSQVEVIKDVLKLAKAAGYETTLVYVRTDLEVALDRNRQRDRTLADEMVIDYWNKCENTFEMLSKEYDNVWVVFNNEPYDFINRPTDRIKKIK
jgi:predicted kinase